MSLFVHPIWLLVGGRPVAAVEAERTAAICRRRSASRQTSSPSSARPAAEATAATYSIVTPRRDRRGPPHAAHVLRARHARCVARRAAGHAGPSRGRHWSERAAAVPDAARQL